MLAADGIILLQFFGSQIVSGREVGVQQCPDTHNSLCALLTSDEENHACMLKLKFRHRRAAKGWATGLEGSRMVPLLNAAQLSICRDRRARR